MFFLNLTAAEFLTLLGALSGLITALYLLDRTRRKVVVSTLRFWTPALTATDQRSRKRIREPWSLVLQILSLILLLLAIAQVQLGTRDRRGHDHVLLLDTSSWAAETAGDRTLLDREKAVCRRYIASLPARDRIMILRADGLATPATSFTSDRGQLIRALNELTPGFSALNIEQALAFACQAQSWSGGQQGEIVYVGPRLAEPTDAPLQPIPNLRVIAVPADREHCGIRRIGVRRSDVTADGWQATVTLKNYGTQPHTVRLHVQVAHTPFTPRVFVLQGGQEMAAEYSFTTNTAGKLIAELEPQDVFSSDRRAALELPRNGALRVAVYTDRPAVLRPLLEANHLLDVKFFPAAAYVSNPAADILLLDRIAPAAKPRIASLWIAPPQDGSPLPVKAVISGAVINNWHSETPLATGLHAKEARLPVAEVFQTFTGDIPVGSVSEGPAVVARPESDAQPRLAVIGFDPLDGQLKFEVTTPLLFANLLHWLSPEAFRALDITAAHAGAATVALDPSERTDRIRVVDDQGAQLPFTIRNRALQLFANRPGIVRVLSEDRERLLSLTLPDVAEIEWNPSTRAASGLPVSSAFSPSATDLWQVLALLGGLCLLIEWLLFGRNRIRKFRWARTPEAVQPTPKPEHDRELVSK